MILLRGGDEKSGYQKILTVVAAIAGIGAFAWVPPVGAAFGDRITVAGTEFKAGDDRIWINGANTPWHSWNDFGGKYDQAWWDNHFQRLHENGINAARVWISCNGETGIEIDASGHVSGCSRAFWRDLDSLFQIARNRQVYIKATLLSFDHFSNKHSHFMSWRSMITSRTNIDSIVENYVVPFVHRYQNNPWLWSVDLCNEPDWIYENAGCGKISWDWIQTYFAKAAVAIHANSKVLVTVGISMGPKYNSTDRRTNVLSDRALQDKAEGDSRARLDFYSPHHYDWMVPAWGSPFYMSPGDYAMDASKPVVIGECPAKGTKGHSATEDYEQGYQHGWQGAMGWTSNGVDANGGLSVLGPGTQAFRDNHRNLVFPGAATPAITPTPSPSPTPPN